MSQHPYRMVEEIRQSPPLDTSEPYDAAWIAGKTILITGGASGFGEGFFRKWAEHGANVIIGDINDKRGIALVERIRETTQNQNHHYIHCDVTDWQSQVDFFHGAIKLSPTGGIDAVVANAGTTDAHSTYERPHGLDADTPSEPNLLAFNVNLVGVLYTAQLAIFYLPRNARLESVGSTSYPEAYRPDRHLLLIGSMASLSPLPGGALYTVSKHGVLGLFRSLRSTAFFNGIRVNMLCPYYMDTPLLPTEARFMLAGSAMGKPEDVVDAGTRLMADSRIVGRALVVGPKVKTRLDDDGMLVPELSKGGKETAIWEAYADDFEQVDAFTARFIRMLNLVQIARGWAVAFLTWLKRQYTLS